MFFIGFIVWISNRELIKSREHTKKSEAILGSGKSFSYKNLMVVNRSEISELEQKAQFGEISKGIIHDMISPLSSISMYVAEIGDKGGSSIKETKDMLNKTVTASQRMQSYMESVRHGLSSDKTTNKIENVDMAQEIKIIQDLLAYKARMAGVKFTVKCNKIYMQAKPIHIHQILLNLTSNAIEAFGDHKSFDDHEASQLNKKKLITLSVKKARSSHVIIKISDNGCGIKDEDKTFILSDNFSRKGSMRGLGLMTVKRIVEQELHGSISFESEVGKGTTFTIQIPPN